MLETQDFLTRGVELRETLVKALVKALFTLVLGLREAYLLERADYASGKAIALARKLHRQSPRRHYATLASQLHLLGVPLHDDQCLNGPCTSKCPCVGLQLQLYQAEGGPSASSLEDALTQYGDRLHNEGRHDDAFTVNAEVVDICREYYQAEPPSHAARLASLLHSHGTCTLRGDMRMPAP